MNARFDIAVVGSGFAGSLLAMIARRLGRSVALLERGRHPRFAIGESSTPLANLLLEHIAHRYNLPRLEPLARWGAWQKHYPHVACGLKRGFTFYHHQFDQPWRENPNRDNHLLVAASPHDSIADTHWYRAEFDQLLACEAQREGAEFIDEASLSALEFSDQGVRLRGNRLGQPLDIAAKFVLDATGPRGFLYRAHLHTESPFEHLPPTAGLYTHFRGVQELRLTSPLSTSPPYPVDDAAVHHIFPGGWIWVLRFNNGVTSAGIAATTKLAAELALHEGAPAWDRLLDRLPTVRDQFRASQPALPFIHSPKLSFRADRIVGNQWALAPSAAGIVDPLLSTGFPLTLMGILRLAKILEEDWDTPRFNPCLRAYETQTFRELETAQRLVAALYATMDDFELFTRLALLYFAAASFTETAWRLEKPQLAGSSFLLGDHATFAPAFRTCLDTVLADDQRVNRPQLMNLLADAINPVDIAGLTDFKRRNWYPVRAEDLMAARHKLGATPGEISGLLRRAGF